jgi:hypothetical protein
MSKQVRGKAASIAIERSGQAQSAFLITTSLILLQAADGVLTSMGVSRYGVNAEGNPLLRALITEFGNVPTLGFVKCIAIVFILALYYYSKRLPWIQNAMGAISCVYLFAAVLPWTYVLFISEWL